MRKEEISSYCKKIGAKCVSNQTMANHNKKYYRKGEKLLMVDSSPSSENIWDCFVLYDGGSGEHVPSYESLVKLFN
jgi:hypothetical protein